MNGFFRKVLNFHAMQVQYTVLSRLQAAAYEVFYHHFMRLTFFISLLYRKYR